MNKANIDPIPCECFIISTGEVQKYLQDKLGFSVDCDFTRWTGVTPDKSYIRMRCVMSPDDVLVPQTNANFIDSIVAKSISGTPFKSNVVNTLKPFMYPEVNGDIRNHQEDIQRMNAMGLYGDHLREIINFTKLTYCQTSNKYGVYLAAENIIEDMLTDPTTGKVDGTYRIIGVLGTTSETIRWVILVSRAKSTLAQNGLNIDKVFQNR